MSDFSSALKISCSDASKMADLLAMKYNEAPIIAGITDGGLAIFRVWKSAAGESWSATMTYFSEEAQRRISCLIANGSDIESVIWFIPGQAL
jgi:hypothetical protein